MRQKPTYVFSKFNGVTIKFIMNGVIDFEWISSSDDRTLHATMRIYIQQNTT